MRQITHGLAAIRLKTIMDEASSPHLRAALLDQLTYLLFEVAAMEPVIARLYESELVHTTHGLSVKQCYGAIVVWDSSRVIPVLRTMKGLKVQEPAGDPPDWNELPLRDILDRIRETRRTLVELAHTLEDVQWSFTCTDDSDDVYGLLYKTVQHDTDRLQTVAKRLYRGT